MVRYILRISAYSPEGYDSNFGKASMRMRAQVSPSGIFLGALCRLQYLKRGISIVGRKAGQIVLHCAIDESGSERSKVSVWALPSIKLDEHVERSF